MFYSQPRHSVPKAMLTSSIFACVSAAIVISITAAQAPGVDVLSDATVILPLQFGLKRLFQTSSKAAQLLIGVPVVATAGGSILYASERVMCALAIAGLFPPDLIAPVAFADGIFTARSRTALASLVLAFLLVILVAITGVESFTDLALMSSLAYNIFILGGFASYIIFKNKLTEIERTFISPFGVSGAVVGILLTLLQMICTVFVLRSWLTLIYLLVLIGAASLYYVFVGRDRQRLSPEERSILLGAHVLLGEKDTV